MNHFPVATSLSITLGILSLAIYYTLYTYWGIWFRIFGILEFWCPIYTVKTCYSNFSVVNKGAALDFCFCDKDLAECLANLFAVESYDSENRDDSDKSKCSMSK